MRRLDLATLREAFWSLRSQSSLRERGFELVQDDREPSLRDTDANRKLLCDLFRDRMASAKVISFETHNGRGDDFILRGVSVVIRNLAEILTLPVPDAGTVEA